MHVPSIEMIGAAGRIKCKLTEQPQWESRGYTPIEPPTAIPTNKQAIDDHAAYCGSNLRMKQNPFGPLDPNSRDRWNGVFEAARAERFKYDGAKPEEGYVTPELGPVLFDEMPED